MPPNENASITIISPPQICAAQRASGATLRLLRLSQKCHIFSVASHNSPWPSCGSTSTTQSEFTPGCSVRALACAGVPRPPSRLLMTCERRATGLASKRGRRSQPNSKRPQTVESMAHSSASPCTSRGLAATLSSPPLETTCHTRSTHSRRYPRTTVEGDIFIRCPTTGQPVPTGFHTRTVVFHKPKYVCTAPLVKKITDGTAALNQSAICCVAATECRRLREFSSTETASLH